MRPLDIAVVRHVYRDVAEMTMPRSGSIRANHAERPSGAPTVVSNGSASLSQIVQFAILFLALSGMAQTNNVVVRVEPSYHMVGSLTMLDGRVYQAQEATLFTNYENVVMFEGQPHTNLLKSVQGVTLTNFADYKFVRTDAPVMPPLPPKLPK
jgi:hypothetical protein